MDTYLDTAKKIIKAQEDIVGSVAFDLAKKVPGITIGSSEKDITIEGDKKTVLNNLIEQYENLFGLASIEVCKKAANDFIQNTPKDQLPPLLA